MYIYKHLLEICFQIIGCARGELFKNKQKKQLYYLSFFFLKGYVKSPYSHTSYGFDDSHTIAKP